MRPTALSTFCADSALATSSSDRSNACSRAGSTVTRNSSTAPPWTWTRATPAMPDSSGRNWYWARSRSRVCGSVAEVRLYAMTGNTVGSMRLTPTRVPAGSCGRVCATAESICSAALGMSVPQLKLIDTSAAPRLVVGFERDQHAREIGLRKQRDRKLERGEHPAQREHEEQEQDRAAVALRPLADAHRAPSRTRIPSRSS